jgi:hypothetical protein
MVGLFGLYVPLPWAGRAPQRGQTRLPTRRQRGPPSFLGRFDGPVVVPTGTSTSRARSRPASQGLSARGEYDFLPVLRRRRLTTPTAHSSDDPGTSWFVEAGTATASTTLRHRRQTHPLHICRLPPHNPRKNGHPSDHAAMLLNLDLDMNRAETAIRPREPAGGRLTALRGTPDVNQITCRQQLPSMTFRRQFQASIASGYIHRHGRHGWARSSNSGAKASIGVS